MNPTDLLEQAWAARRQAYAPYSNFGVGAALLTRDGRVFTGCNVENATYGLTVCAERTAVCKAVSEGCRDFAAIAVVSETGATPCGACRQVLTEFGVDQVIVAGSTGEPRIYTLAELFPYAFDSRQLT
ncbi:MAG: cytidine deaminase [Chloroflexi bacterium]|nr:cytidine deaminase [Chloroflexota bacterium]MBU1749542.1 cytidine deaminase [Chloroflexota bacterium]MBU1878790.1 cytidine deaminase [Chloroflexota bacterium]